MLKRPSLFRSLTALAAAACLLLAAVPARAAAGLAGSGTAADPWLIDSEYALTMAYQRMLDEGTAEHYLLTADITLTRPLDNSFLPSANVIRVGASQASLAADGVFDGGGHTIYNLAINSTSNEGSGFSFFEFNEGTIQNLNLVYADDYVYTGYDPMWGGMADYNLGHILNCSVTADVTIGDVPCAELHEGSGFGMIAGASADGSIVNCTARGALNGPQGYVHGLIGVDEDTTVSGCTDQVSLNGGAPGAGAAPTEISVVLDGQRLTFDQPPIAVDGRTLVPVRAIFEALGAEVEWDPSDQSIFAYRASDGAAVLLYLGNTTMGCKPSADAEAVAIQLDVPPMAVNNRTLVPVRAISESFGCTVSWDQANQRVVITTY
ncbi:copper amine oxidase N-terminal domain-containing protein [uncultured Intestinimonas sp.]|uniref:copper amine oxidase N-terminal domain-containing protein n=1 Tax=uncultured Intestinimonas sp. TaxID=1689265 RepID=UPI0025D57E49|nr:copper amine oxidase N-terminal domain-containing protein [uncultured Intestinimonas sp.]